MAKKMDALQVTGIIKAETLKTIKGWDKLSGEERSSVILESQKLGRTLLMHSQSRLAIGEHLVTLHGILEPHRMFQSYLKNFHFSERSAYRHMKSYENSKTILPATIMKAAMVRNVQILGESSDKPLGIYTAAAAALPPPVDATETQANEYLDQLEAVRKTKQKDDVQVMVPRYDQNVLMKECLRFVASRYSRLPNRKATREAWVQKFFGMCLSEFGMSAQSALAPLSVPEQFAAPKRGRPVGSVAAPPSSSPATASA